MLDELVVALTHGDHWLSAWSRRLVVALSDRSPEELLYESRDDLAGATSPGRLALARRPTGNRSGGIHLAGVGGKVESLSRVVIGEGCRAIKDLATVHARRGCTLSFKKSESISTVSSDVHRARTGRLKGICRYEPPNVQH